MIKEIKERAKAAYKRNYWPSVFAALLMTSGLTVTAASSAGSANSAMQSQGQNISVISGPSDVLAMLIGVLAMVFLTAFILGVLYDAFFGNPLSIGGKIFFLKSSEDPSTNVKEVMAGFDKGWYMNNVKTMFLTKLVTGLGFILFVIPGVILTYSYMLVPYIITDDPTIGGTDAMKMSREMMKGWKWKAFVLGLSFIGWDILSALTANILGIFMVKPYKQAAEAELYRMIRDSHVEKAVEEAIVNEVTE